MRETTQNPLVHFYWVGELNCFSINLFYMVWFETENKTGSLYQINMDKPQFRNQLSSANLWLIWRLLITILSLTQTLPVDVLLRPILLPSNYQQNV